MTHDITRVYCALGSLVGLIISYRIKCTVNTKTKSLENPKTFQTLKFIIFLYPDNQVNKQWT